MRTMIALIMMMIMTLARVTMIWMKIHIESSKRI